MGIEPLVRIEIRFWTGLPVPDSVDRDAFGVANYFIDAACALRGQGERWIVGRSRTRDYAGPYANCVALEYWPYWEPCPTPPGAPEGGA